MKKTAVLFAASCAALAVSAAPQLKTQAEIVADGELKARVLAGSRGIPPPTPPMHQYRITRDGVSSEVKWYVVADLWRQRAFAGEWKDRHGNVMRLARVLSLAPVFERGDWYKEEIDKGLDECEKAFKNSVAYIQSWLQMLKNDNHAIVWASSRAEKAAKYILFGKQPEVSAVIA